MATPGIFHRLFKVGRSGFSITHTPVDEVFGLSTSKVFLHAFFATNVTDVFEGNVGTVGIRQHPSERGTLNIYEFKVKPEFYRNGVAIAMLRHILLTYRSFGRKLTIDIPRKDLKLKDFLHNNNFMLVGEDKNRYFFIHYFDFEPRGKHDDKHEG